VQQAQLVSRVSMARLVQQAQRVQLVRKVTSVGSRWTTLLTVTLHRQTRAQESLSLTTLHCRLLFNLLLMIFLTGPLMFKRSYAQLMIQLRQLKVTSEFLIKRTLQTLQFLLFLLQQKKLDSSLLRVRTSLDLQHRLVMAKMSSSHLHALGTLGLLAQRVRKAT
jgi:hypothetical protein